MGIYFISGLMCKYSTTWPWERYGLLSRFCLLMILCLPVQVLQAQQERSTEQTKAQDWLKQRGEVIVRFIRPANVPLDLLSTFLSIEGIRNDTVTAYANETGFLMFASLQIPFAVLPPPSLNPGIFSTSRMKEGDWRDRYPSYPGYVELMEGFAADYPQLCRLEEFGTTVRGKKLLALKISDQPEIRETEPVVFFTASMHGNELVGYMLMLRLIDHLLTHYETDPEIRYLVDHIELWINPLANPDGTYAVSDSTVAGATRFNANQVDLNRNFPELGDPYWAGRPRQPETKAMMDFMSDLELVLAANFHGGAELVNYPWDSWRRPHADDAWYWYISRNYADTVHLYSPPGYMTEIDNGITNGYAWYQVLGGRQDYTNFFLHAREVTIELSKEMIPPESSLHDFWNFNRESLLQYAGRTLTGISGQVTDSITGQPVRAEIWLDRHDFDSSFVYAASNGVFYRMVNGWQYVVRFVAPGYITQKRQVRVTEGELTSLDIKLAPVSTQGLFPNPFTNFLYLYLEDPGNDLTAEFFDLSGRKILQITQAAGSPGRQVVETNSLPQGVYLVRIICGDQVTRQIMHKMRVD